jgi:hypothetical protein
MKDCLARLRKKVAIGFVGGSDISKQYEQLGNTSKWMIQKKKGGGERVDKALMNSD